MAEELSEQHMEMMDTILALDGVAPAIVGRGAQAALHVYAEGDVFLLDFVTESDGPLDAFPVDYLRARC